MAIKLLTADAVIQRMSLGDHEDILNAVDSALNGVTAAIESTLGVNLSPLVDNVEMYLPNVKKFWDTTPQGLLRLRLKNAFVNPGTVELKFADSLGAVRGHNGEVIPDDEYDVDFENGYIYLDLFYDLRYVSVKYSSGLLVPAGTSEETDVPEWMQEVALAYVPVVMNQNQTTNRSAEMEPVIAALSAQAAGLLQSHIRNLPFAHTAIL
jgi:hypothetical protein